MKTLFLTLVVLVGSIFASRSLAQDDLVALAPGASLEVVETFVSGPPNPQMGVVLAKYEDLGTCGCQEGARYEWKNDGEGNWSWVRRGSWEAVPGTDDVKVTERGTDMYTNEGMFDTNNTSGGITNLPAGITGNWAQ